MQQKWQKGPLGGRFFYNSQLHKISFKEYGRNIENMANNLLKIEDREERSRLARGLVQLMRQLNPHLSNNPDVEQKLWDHLHAMAQFELDVEAPFPAPPKEIYTKKPDPMPYSQSRIKYRNYGQNLELLVEKVKATENKEEKQEGEVFIGKMMKTYYAPFNHRSTNDKAVLSVIEDLSAGEINLTPDDIEVSKNPFHDKAKTAFGNTGERGRGRSKKSRPKKKFQRKKK